MTAFLLGQYMGEDRAVRDGDEPEPGWMVVGDRRMFVVGFTAGGAPYGCYEDEFDEQTW